MTGYTELVAILLTSVFILLCILIRVLWPRRWIEIFRGGEISVCFAFAIDVARRIILISVSNFTYPGVFWGTVNLSLFAVVILFLGSRISQHIRHQMINRQHARENIEALRARGEDVTELEKSMKKPNKSKDY